MSLLGWSGLPFAVITLVGLSGLLTLLVNFVDDHC